MAFFVYEVGSQSYSPGIAHTRAEGPLREGAALHSARNSYHRMRAYGVLIAEGDQVDPLDVYARDRWTCQLWHVAIDPAVDWAPIRG